MRKWLYPVTLFISVSAVSLLKAAVPLLVWGDQHYVETTTSFSGTPVVADNVARYAYSWDNPLSPGSGYTGPRFWGTVEARAGKQAIDDGLTPGFSRIDINSGTAARIRIDASGVNSAPAPRGSLHGLIVFKKSEFLGSASTVGSTVQFDQDSQLSLDASSLNSSPRGVRFAVHAKVEEEWKWYLSETNITVAGMLAIDDAAGANWGEWAGPSTTTLLPDAPTEFTTLGSTFEDIDAVGYYFFMSNSSNGSSAPFMQFGEFSVSAVTTIPEAQHLAILSAMGLFVVCFLGRNRRQLKK